MTNVVKTLRNATEKTKATAYSAGRGVGISTIYPAQRGQCTAEEAHRIMHRRSSVLDEHKLIQVL